ncbi:8345_t:CDS:2 [Ambispora leptoticha]|uniref:8345_t:CDS:1 n=1 Tax=Ambispora leptoticha TaxID=144679 RepID=A0A9N9AA28_9GLOM|nr:8345_t:CDS:2 [Ambispora leptoticha]
MCYPLKSLASESCSYFYFIRNPFTLIKMNVKYLIFALVLLISAVSTLAVPVIPVDGGVRSGPNCYYVYGSYGRCGPIGPIDPPVVAY